MFTRSTDRAVFAACVLIVPTAALANMPMFFVVAFTRFVYWWTIPAAIILEWVAIRFIFKVSWPSALVFSLGANLLSAALGILVYPLIGTALYPALAPTVIGVFGYGPAVEATATTLAMAAVDTAVELGFIALVLRTAKINEGLFFLGANIATAALLLGTILYANAPPRLAEEDRSAFLAEYAAELDFLTEVLKEAPDNLGVSEFRFSEIWLDKKSAEAEDLRFNTLSVATEMRMDHIVSSYGRGMFGATLLGLSEWEDFTIRHWARDPRDGGGTYWTVVGVLDRGEARFSVNAEIE